MSSLATYRALVPSHAGILDPVIEAWLSVAASAHSAAAFGAVYVPAMCMWTAAHLEPQVVAGTLPMVDNDGNICAVPKPDPDAPAVKIPKVEETSFWSAYLGFVRSRAATAPFHVSPGLCPPGWPLWGVP